MCVFAELQVQVNQMTSDLKEERVSGKRVRGELRQLQEEHSELVTERETLQKVCVHAYCYIRSTCICKYVHVLCVCVECVRE